MSSSGSASPASIGQALYATVLRMMETEENVNIVSKLMPSLLQAGCLGDNRALHLASVLYSSGLGVKKQLHKVCSCEIKIRKCFCIWGSYFGMCLFVSVSVWCSRPGCYQCWELRRIGGWLFSGWGICTMWVMRAWQQTLISPMRTTPTSPSKPQLTDSNLPHNRFSISLHIYTRAIFPLTLYFNIYYWAIWYFY